MNGRMTILACIIGFLLDCIFGDPVWMYHPIRVIGNLINNAINYTSKEDKQIFVTQKNTPEGVRIEVRDTGDGIEEDKIKLIFDKYYRSENHKREVVGTGLGLSIVKAILKMHGYDYGVNSKLGEGSTFWFVIRDVVTDTEAEAEAKPSA